MRHRLHTRVGRSTLIMVIINRNDQLVIRTLLRRTNRLRVNFTRAGAFNRTHISPFRAMTIRHIIAVMRRHAIPTITPVTRPAYQATITHNLLLIRQITHLNVSMNMNRTRTVNATRTPIRLHFNTKRLQNINITHSMLIITRQLTSRPNSFIMRRLRVSYRPRLNRRTIMTRFPQTRPFLIRITKTTNLSRVADTKLTMNTKLRINRLVTPIRIIFRRIQQTSHFQVRHTRTITQISRMIRHGPQNRQATNRLHIFGRHTTLRRPIFTNTPLRLTRHTPHNIIRHTVRMNLKVYPIMAVIRTTSRSRAVKRTRNILRFRIMTQLTNTLISITTRNSTNTIFPLIRRLVNRHLLNNNTNQYTKTNRRRRITHRTLNMIQVSLPRLTRLQTRQRFNVANTPNLLTIPVLHQTLGMRTIVEVSIRIPTRQTNMVLNGRIKVIAHDNGPQRR